MIRQSNRIVVDERNVGFSLGQAIILAEYGDVIVVHTEKDKRLGEQAARQNRPLYGSSGRLRHLLPLVCGVHRMEKF
jgi:hypothetical protein